MEENLVAELLSATRPSLIGGYVEPRQVVETALQSLIQQDASSYMRWIGDDIAYEAPPHRNLTGRYALFQEIAVFLTPRSGARVASFEINGANTKNHSGASAWVKGLLRFEIAKNGKFFPTDEPEPTIQEAEQWFEVQGDAIVTIKAFPHAKPWQFLAEAR